MPFIQVLGAASRPHPAYAATRDPTIVASSGAMLPGLGRTSISQADIGKPAMISEPEKGQRIASIRLVDRHHWGRHNPILPVGFL